MNEEEQSKEAARDPLADAEVIFSYTRAEALADGVLVGVSELAREAGVRYPVAVTRRVWDEVVTPRDEDRPAGQSETGRLWDLLWMLRVASQAAPGNQDRLDYKMLVFRKGLHQEVQLTAVCGPGDNGEPVITVMIPGED